MPAPDAERREPVADRCREDEPEQNAANHGDPRAEGRQGCPAGGEARVEADEPEGRQDGGDDGAMEGGPVTGEQNGRDHCERDGRAPAQRLEA